LYLTGSFSKVSYTCDSRFVDNGCNGVCGSCPVGFICNSTSLCQAAGSAASGSCGFPFLLINSSNIPFFQRHVIQGDSSKGSNLLAPACNVLSDAREVIYMFTTPSNVTGMIGTVMMLEGDLGYDYDSVLELYEGTCGPTSTPFAASPNSVGCSDDATPPGGVGSRLDLTLKVNTTYYIHVDGYSVLYSGPFKLTVDFVLNCAPKCDGDFCSDNGCGFPCPPGCGVGFTCSPTEFQCFPDACIPNCTNANCGLDGCGGQCGMCSVGDGCSADPTASPPELTGICGPVPAPCDSFNPVCTGCNTTQYCGIDCICHNPSDPLPDIIVDIPLVFTEVAYFANSSCAIRERCMSVPGFRRILRVTVRNINYGYADTGIPGVKARGDLFMYSTCHGHYHFTNFAKYILMDRNGIIVADGGKESYCLEDSGAVFAAPWVECNPYYDCGNQGVQRGWTDEYDATLDCQYLDITGVKAGDYRLEIQTNVARNIPEIAHTNSYFAVDLTLSDDVSAPLIYSVANDPVNGFTTFSGAGGIFAVFLNVFVVVILVLL